MIESLVIAFGAVALAVWTLAPFFRPKPLEPSTASARLAQLIESKHAVYRSILDLEFDNRVGKISDSDYLVLRRQHESDAIAILKEMDLEASAESNADLLETEISAARDRLRRR